MGTLMAATGHLAFLCLYVEKHIDSEAIHRPGNSATINYCYVPGVVAGIVWEGNELWPMSGVFGMPSLNLLNRAKFLSLPLQNTHNLIPVPAESLGSCQDKKNISSLKPSFYHLSFLEAPYLLNFSDGTYYITLCIFDIDELYPLLQTAPEGGCHTPLILVVHIMLPHQ